MTDIALFAGPSTFGLTPNQWDLPGLKRFPPIGRDDITRLVQANPSPGIIIICDGVFDCRPAVSHREICLALDQGWQVWGVSSLGAIRAREMACEGMRGFGYVYDLFCQEDDYCDDEACLLHFPESPYFPVSEPLVNIRYALEKIGSSQGIAANDATALITWLRSLWFGERTPTNIRHFMTQSLGIDEANITGFFNWLENNRIKALDLRNLLTCQPWNETASRDQPSQCA